MNKQTHRFSRSATDFYFDGRISHLKELADARDTVVITDEQVFAQHTRRFRNWKTIVLKPGEAYKVQATVDSIVSQLVELEAGRSTTLVGVGGGVITDITGYVASIYMRGIRFGFVPSSLLGMVDASIGGKNGIDWGVYKNILGNTSQPCFILYDFALLGTLPENEWRNGFAEIIKHACIKDAAMFKELQQRSFAYYFNQKKRISPLVQRNARLKIGVVKRDEFEKNERKLLNFGHTLGHALENQYDLSHGQAISIGIACDCAISAQLTSFRQGAAVVELLDRYGLPTYASFSKAKVFEVLKMDKKRQKKEISYVLLERVGKAAIRQIQLSGLQHILDKL